MPYLFITTTNIISQNATLENFEKFIGPLYTVLIAFSIYLFITYHPNPQAQEEEMEDDEEECEEDEEMEEDSEDHEEERGEEECEEEIVKSQ